jgi:heme/copper-type cytochrome/quinol oxidase subunit 2
MHHLIYLARLIVVALLVFTIVRYAQRNGSSAHRRGIAFAWAVIVATIVAAW